MTRISVIFVLAVLGLSIEPGVVVAQTTPLAGSAGAGNAAVSGIPSGPGSIGGVNNSVNDPSGIGNAARIAPPAAGNAVVPIVPPVSPNAGVAAPRSRYVPPKRRFAGRKMSEQEAETRVKENDRLLGRSLKSICRGC